MEKLLRFGHAHLKFTRSRGIKMAGQKGNENNTLGSFFPPKLADPRQGQLSLGIEKQREIDGIGMGVLSDGTPFLSGRGLSRLCGVRHFVIQELSSEWNEPVQKPRVSAIKKILESKSVSLPHPYVEVIDKGTTFFAYPDTFCLAVLEYYAFDAGANVKEQAQAAYRQLAGQALRDFIYSQVGYDPTALVPDVWRNFHDRVSLTYNSVPAGYFGIFKEMADMIVNLGQAGLHIDSSFVPDISVGQHWSTHWRNKGYDAQFGPRIKFEHNFPEYYPQATANPQEPWCYPEAALGEFRRWLREDYIGAGKFVRYLEGKIAQKQLPPSFAQIAASAYRIEQD
ncbi:hypothetical protein [Stenotrophomonas maltophilia]|uniref:hypothetical protein n=2 Tax=Stenotrophomonas maltophilia TaxID=40324 RepID=UPI0013D9A73A|nr:hypothetical protein [Stenotrophomonas maltophilia]